MSTTLINPSGDLSVTRKAMARSEANANPTFNQLALDVVKRIAGTQLEITTEDVRKIIEVEAPLDAITHDMSAIGPVMVRAEQAGYITKIEGRAVKSSRPSSHGRLLRVFKSNLYAN